MGLFQQYIPEKKTARLCVAMTETEYLKLNEGADRAKQRVSDYIRELIVRHYDAMVEGKQ